LQRDAIWHHRYDDARAVELALGNVPTLNGAGRKLIQFIRLQVAQNLRFVTGHSFIADNVKLGSQTLGKLRQLLGFITHWVDPLLDAKPAS